MGTLDHVRSRAIERQIATDYGRDRIAKALYEVIHDRLPVGPRDLPTTADREWIRSALARPIQETTEVTLRVLAWRLAQALDRAPDGLLTRLDASPRWAELGWG